ncbi:hypothetical protein THTE_0230 [Thermogutta terrifontis]|uniref:Uncharacterized protein n=1 Tax=Thermogutta terrifontis TaxID=1331910 RepID=A0A286RA57_9BACT|nr:hypothetical protein THTE_0230 [Thermogutta terrifontis]
MIVPLPWELIAPLDRKAAQPELRNAKTWPTRRPSEKPSASVAASCNCMT